MFFFPLISQLFYTSSFWFRFACFTIILMENFTQKNNKNANTIQNKMLICYVTCEKKYVAAPVAKAIPPMIHHETGSIFTLMQFIHLIFLNLNIVNWSAKVTIMHHTKNENDTFLWKLLFFRLFRFFSLFSSWFIVALQ